MQHHFQRHMCAMSTGAASAPAPAAPPPAPAPAATATVVHTLSASGDLKKRAFHISQGRRVSCQLRGFSLVTVILALFVPTGCSGSRGMWGIFRKLRLCGVALNTLRISLEDIHDMPTLWVLALFGIFYNFGFHVQTCRHLGGGGGGMCILFEICKKTPLQKCMGWGKGGLPFFSVAQHIGRCTQTWHSTVQPFLF